MVTSRGVHRQTGKSVGQSVIFRTSEDFIRVFSYTRVDAIHEQSWLIISYGAF